MATRFTGDPADALALDSFVKLMRAAASVSMRIAGPMHTAGLTESQLGVLEALYHLGPMCQKDLAHKVLKSPANLTTVVHNLERDGLVARRVDLADRRRAEIRLTGEGRRLIAELFPRHAAEVARVMGVLDAAEQVELGRLCRRLGRAAEGFGDG